MKSISILYIAACLVLIASPVMAQGEPVITPMEQQQVEQGMGQQMSPTQAEGAAGLQQQQQQSEQQQQETQQQNQYNNNLTPAQRLDGSYNGQ